MTGRISSIQSLGTKDGPGIRYVVFFQGCPLRCIYCHNPETWEFDGGREIDSYEICEKIVRYKSYFGDKGGVTLSGGEPLKQSEFAYEIFDFCKKNQINTALDTSGAILNDSVKKLLTVCDLVILDVKMSSNELYEKHIGIKLNKVLAFLEYLNENNIKTWIRNVVVPQINDDKNSINFIKRLKEEYPCVEKVEFKPFMKICMEKYDELGIDFPLRDTPEYVGEIPD